MSESKENVRDCQKHQLEIVGFCQDDAELLCGACVMEHTDHECFALDDPRVIAEAEKGKIRLIEEEEKIISLQETWTCAKNEVDGLAKSISKLKEAHVFQLKQSEKNLLDTVKSGKKACISELQHLSLREEIKELEYLISNELAGIHQEIAKTREKIEKFDEMDVYEKLAKSEILSGSEAKKIPSLGQLYKLVLKLKAEVNYKSAIKKAHISL